MKRVLVFRVLGFRVLVFRVLGLRFPGLSFPDLVGDPENYDLRPNTYPKYFNIMAVGAKLIPLNCTTFGCWICLFLRKQCHQRDSQYSPPKGHVTLLTFEFVYMGS